jgi:hypothetical protein
MKTIIAMMLAVVTLPVAAQYKCLINGKTVYADAPCASNAKPVGELQDSVSKDQEIQRLKQSLKEQRQRNAIEGKQDRDYQNLQRATATQNANEAAQARANEAARQRKCANLEYDMRQNQRNVALGQDVGWQRTITQHENELKRNRDAYDRECR